jgi:aromatic ring-opening dioxygenase catalytic subunit (LigB family)
MSNAIRRMPTLFIPHGGGPCFFMDPAPGLPADLWTGMGDYLRGIDAAVGQRPAAVLVISGHWATDRPTVNSARQPSLLFDYYGFPEHTYRLTYPVSGSPALASRVRNLLAGAGIASDADAARGLDHGVFVPFKLIYPAADVPIVQLSLLLNMDARQHLALGQALRPLRDEGVLIVGSGMSYHNLREMFAERRETLQAAAQFDAWLTEAVTDRNPDSRLEKLSKWYTAPGARASHPTPEHLVPLLVAAGAAGDEPGRRTYNELLIGKPISGFTFGNLQNK